MDSGKRLLRTIFFTGLAFLLNYILQMVLAGHITNTLGADAFGFVSLAKNAAQYAGILTLTLNDFVPRYIAVSCHTGDYVQANQYRTTAFWGNAWLSLFILAVVSAGLPVLDRLLCIPACLSQDVKALFFITFLNLSLTAIFGVFESAAILTNRLDQVGMMKGAACLAETALLFSLFKNFPPRLCYAALGSLTASIVMGSTYLHLSRRYAPELRIRKGRFSFSAVRTLITNGVWSAAAQLGNVLNSGLDLLVCNWMLSPLAMGQLAIVKTLEAMAHSLAHLIFRVFQPLVLKSYGKGDKSTLVRELKLSMKLSGFLMNVVFAGVLALGPSFFRLWVPSQDIHRLWVLSTVTLLLCVVSGIMTPLYHVYTLTVQKKLPCIVNVMAGLLNVISMYYLIRHTELGVYAVSGTTTVIMGTVCLVFHPLYLAHCLALPPTVFYPCIFRSLLSCAVQALCFLRLGPLLPGRGWVGLFLRAGALAGLGAAIHMILVCEREDWKKMGILLDGRKNFPDNTTP